MNRAELGKIGETLACQHLQKHGYTIICRNYFSRFGEIDIIAEKGSILAIVEVKTRPENAMVSGLEAVTRSKQRKLIRTAVQYLSEHGLEKQPRFDIIEITLHLNEGRRLYTANHIENAFDASGIYTPF